MVKQLVGVFARRLLLCLALGLGLAQGAQAALFTTSYGTALTGPSNCDDCFEGPFAFGTGHSMAFFGTTYTGLYVSSNGYVTFGSGASNFSSQPLDTQTIAPMIAGLFTDLDSRSDATSEVYVNNSTPGQIIVTWVGMGHFAQIYTVRSTFQLVIRSDQFTVPAGEGQIGFFYDSVTDTSTASAGFGDGLAAVNTGEVAFHSGTASALSNASGRWYNLNGGVPQTPTATPQNVPTLGEWTLIALGLLLGALGMRQARRQG
ncbi:MAG: IPTL-CTERM sorting domain-containing protein [Ottowia sp.]|uniref:IPTL-CTERM sorting domain-containing protein n=1 Tax=Ottowia sp. TaxID=1898956 RepID=UPI0039E37219